MNEKPELKNENLPLILTGEFLRSMDADQFAALGAGKLVFMRPILGRDLAKFLPLADLPDDKQFDLVLSAEGTPLMVTDDQDTILEWVEENELDLAGWH